MDSERKAHHDSTSHKDVQQYAADEADNDAGAEWKVKGEVVTFD